MLFCIVDDDEHQFRTLAHLGPIKLGPLENWTKTIYQMCYENMNDVTSCICG